jgi:CCR4-NOT complex subunit CAF16
MPLMLLNRTSLLFPDATHIFDGLNDFPTHLVHMRFGSFVTLPTFRISTGLDQPRNSTSAATPLYTIALQWLREDREFRRELEKQGQKMRGARRNEASIFQLWRGCELTRIFHS